MTDPYVEYFLSAGADVAQLDLIEISHPDMTQVYRYVRNQRGGVTVTLPSEGSATFEYRPMNIRRDRDANDLVQGISIDIGDPGVVVVGEMDALVAANTYNTRPILRYWAYRSDDLSIPLIGPFRYEVISVSTRGPQCTIRAEAPERNASGTGELYTFVRFPMLRGV
jgi:hypothetical protein